MSDQLSPVLFIPHGGGPLPLLGDASHQSLVNFLKAITPRLGLPESILLISAHWEEAQVNITSNATPTLIYDYAGFPEQAYEIQYPASGDPALANRIYKLLIDHNIDARLNVQRGFDHGLFVPLTIMYPEASIPCVQISLLHNLDPQAHINIGKALVELRRENILVIGSGFSFHNLKAFFSHSPSPTDLKNEAFEQWLVNICTNRSISSQQREAQLVEWNKAPFAKYCHPREEHLLPLHVCFGMSHSAAELVFDGKVLDKKCSAYLW